ncbi:MAG TPA: dynamin family protein [Fusobacterium sp.]|uniref:dynamin family protein n=1 Tax=Fusobacterium sp. TaxID=68766 RepID=UPI002F417C52
MKEKVFQRYQDYQGYMKQFGIEEEKELQQEKRDIENRRFVVMIVGEAKSGKSSFIDAYLKTDVLPIDVKQCTNALIHIRHSERVFLEVHQENQSCRLEEEEDIQNFLNREANFSKSGKQRELELFLFYPLEKEFQEIELIDSPGVNAEGGLGVISEEYLPSANAIIFVKSLYGQALESTSFIDFFRGKTKRRHKESRFLLLTGSSLFSKQDKKSLEKDAEEKYGDYISSEKIIILDSKLKLFWNACQDLSEEEIEQKIQEEEFDSATVLWYQAKGKKDIFMRNLLEKSNFPHLEEKLRIFAKDYEKILCLQFLGNIQEAYQRQILIFEAQKQTLMEHRKDPVALQASLDANRKEIQELSQKIETGVQKLYEKFTRDDFLDAILEESYQTWRGELSLFQGNINWEKLELWFQEKMKESSKLSLEIGEKMIEECQEKLFNDGRKIYLEIFKPNRMDYEVIKPDKVKGDFFQISEMLSSLKGHLKVNMKRNLENCLYKFTGKMHANCNRLEYACEELMNQQWNSENLRIKIEEISEKISILEKQKEEILWELKS